MNKNFLPETPPTFFFQICKWVKNYLKQNDIPN